MHSAHGQKMRSLVGMPVLQVVQHVKSLEQLRVERIYRLTFMDTVEKPKTIICLRKSIEAMSPDLWVTVTQDLRQQLRRLLEAATQLVQFLLHGEDTLLQLPIGVVPIGTEVAHDHLHLREVHHLTDVISQLFLFEA